MCYDRSHEPTSHSQPVRVMEPESRADVLVVPAAGRRVSLEHAVGAAFFALFLLSCILLTRRIPESWNDMSRVAAIESLVERGVWSIDESAWAGQTGDKAFVRGHYYSGKMPILAAAGAVVYGVVHRLSGADLGPNCEQSPGGCAYYWLTLVLSGVPGAGLLWLFYEYARRQRIGMWAAAAATVALGFGTMVWSYAMVLNSHLPAAVALFACLYLLLNHPGRGGLAAAGFCAALAAAIELQAVLLGGALFLTALLRARRGAVYFVLGALAPILLTVLLDYQITGTLFPPRVLPGAYDYPGGVLPTTLFGTSTPDDLFQYAFKMLVGAQGLFAYNPIMLFAVVGVIVVASARRHSLRAAARLLGLSFLALVGFLLTNTGNLGGEAYGERYYLIAVPLLMSFIVFVPPLAPARLKLPAGLLFAFLLSLSVISAYDGARRPWRYVIPPAQLTRDASSGAIGFKWNLRIPFR